MISDKMQKEQLINIVDLLITHGWLIELLPRLQEQVQDLVEIDAVTDYELRNSTQYIKRVCILLPKISESFSTKEDLPRRENLVKNCLSLSSYNNPKTLALLEIMANHCDTFVYCCCEKLYRTPLSSQNMSRNEHLIMNFLVDKELAKLCKPNLYCLSLLGKDLVSLWLPEV